MKNLIILLFAALFCTNAFAGTQTSRTDEKGALFFSDEKTEVLIITLSPGDTILAQFNFDKKDPEKRICLATVNLNEVPQDKISYEKKTCLFGLHNNTKQSVQFTFGAAIELGRLKGKMTYELTKGP